MNFLRMVGPRYTVQEVLRYLLMVPLGKELAYFPFSDDLVIIIK